MGRMSFTQELKAVALASEGMVPAIGVSSKTPRGVRRDTVSGLVL